MGLFYAVAGALALAVALVLVRPLLAGRGGAAGRDARDAQLYRDQLAEIDRDVERGTISPAEAEGARAEVSRRLLAASARADAAEPLTPAPRHRSTLVAGIAMVGAPALALAVYLANGAPGLPDLPLADRTAESALAAGPSQAEAEAAVLATIQRPAPDALSPEDQEYAALITRLETIVEKRPDDVQGMRLLASGYIRLDRHGDAWKTYERLIELLGVEAEPALYAAQVDAMAIAAGGYLSPEAQEVLAEALARDATHPVTRYYAGLLLAQEGRLGQAIAAWEALKADSPAGAPWLGFLDSMLAEAKRIQSGAPAQDAPGPGAAEIEAAAAMSPEDRQAMIEGMVARLEERLTTEGGQVEEWLRLMNAQVQLGRPEEARRVYALAQQNFTGSEAGFLREQALTLGVIAE